MSFVEQIKHYNRVVTPDGKRLENTFRFRTGSLAKHPQIFREHESLLNHHSYLMRVTPRFLSGVLSRREIEEVQRRLACHDVPELSDGDVSRLDETGTPVGTANDVLQNLLLPEDIPYYFDFERAQQFLEHDSDVLPESALSLVARMIDTVSGNCYVHEIYKNYAMKVGGKDPGDTDPNLQLFLDKSGNYINHVRQAYRKKIASITAGTYSIDLVPVLVQLQAKEKEIIATSAVAIRAQGYAPVAVI